MNRNTRLSKREAYREQARKQAKAKMLMVYVQNAGHAPACQRLDAKPYRNKKLWWLEPLIPNIINYVLVEEEIQDSWQLKVEVLDKRNT